MGGRERGAAAARRRITLGVRVARPPPVPVSVPPPSPSPPLVSSSLSPPAHLALACCGRHAEGGRSEEEGRSALSSSPDRPRPPALSQLFRTRGRLLRLSRPLGRPLVLIRTVCNVLHYVALYCAAYYTPLAFAFAKGTSERCALKEATEFVLAFKCGSGPRPLFDGRFHELSLIGLTTIPLQMYDHPNH